MSDDETVQTTVRLSKEDRGNVAKIVASGAAQNTAEAIRVALANLAQTAPRMKAIEQRLEKDLPPNPMGGYEIEQLLELVKVDGVDRLASEELLRRGYFPDGLGNWVKSHPELTRLVPAAPIKRGPPMRRGGGTR